jgi:2-enoate reductase
MEEGLEAAKLLASYGYDALDVDVGSYDSWWWSHPPMYQKKGLYLEYAAAVKKVVDVPVLCAGRMDEPDRASAAIANGDCDIVSLGRPLLADPDFVNKLRAGNEADIRPCIGCQEGCMGRIQQYSMINCAVNPQCARERYFAYEPILKKKKVLIVGGGVAGCEAARVLAIRGHEPVIYEASDHLGGAFAEAGVPSFKEDDRALIAWYGHTLAELGVEIHFNTKISAAMLQAIPHDAVIVAVGAKAKVFSLGDNSRVITAKEALAAEGANVGKSTVVIGGGMVGCELALWLTKDLQKKVTLVESLPKLLAVNAPICSANKDMLERLVPFHGTEVLCRTTAVKATDTGLLVRNLDSGEEREIPADTIILAVGFTSDQTLYQALQDEPAIYAIGDCKEFHNVHSAIWDAFEVANHL